MSDKSQKSPVDTRLPFLRSSSGAAFLGILCVVLGLLFVRSFDPAWVVFANDGPLGAMMAERGQVPETLTGSWADLNGYGARDPGALPNITFGLLWVLGPLGFAKFYAPIALLLLGLCAWFLFRQLGLGNLAAMLGGLAAALCSDFFGVACWGVGTQAICFGLNYLALAIVVSPKPLRPWLRYPLAGLAVGMGVMEAFDIGAIFSVITAICVVVHALVTGEKRLKDFSLGIGRVAVIGVFAVLTAGAALSSLIGTQIQGVVGTEQDQRTKQERWDWATQWSFPKSEALGIVVPGLFGFRMDTPDGGNYWGKGGRDPAWDRYFASGKQGPPPRGFMRYGGGGCYTGVLLTLVALWALFQSLRKQDSVFSPAQRKFIWFLTGVVGVSLLLSFGRFAPFYQFFYALPYASTIRNPGKFMHVFQWAWLIIFAHGVYGLSRRYLEAPAVVSRDLVAQLQSWWAKVSPFDRKWTMGSAVALGASLLGWLIYAAARTHLINYLQEVQFEEAMAKAIATFSLRQVGWFILLLAISIGLFTVVLSGYFNGRRARIGAVLLGLLLVLDLAWVDTRWVVTYNWKEKYLEAADNPVIDFLRQKPYEQRVTVVPEWLAPGVGAPQQLIGAEQMLDQVYRIEWMQHLFQYNNIQSLDIVQMPRVPTDIAAFEGALQFDGNPQNVSRVSRRWELTNTRYVLGAAGLLNAVKLLDPEQQRFRLLMAFEFYRDRPDGPILTRTNATGPFALFEFTGALPRAQLYANWQVSTNDAATLKELAAKEFDAAKTVLLAENLPLPDPVNATNTIAGKVEFVSYAPKHIVLKTQSAAPAVLLLNDKYDPNWQVTVDGQPSALLRCNYLMRGVQVPKGEHRVEFHFRPPTDSLYVSLATIALGGLLLIATFVVKRG